MGAMGVSINPRKLYRFAVECEGLETAYVQKVKIPKTDIKSAEHGEGPFKIKTASRVEIGQLELDTLKPADSSAVWWKDWVALVVNLDSGSMSGPDVYKKTVSIVEYAPDGVSIIDRWDCYGCFPAEVDPADLDKLGDGNAIDKIKLNCDRIVPMGINGGVSGDSGLGGALRGGAASVLKGLGL